MKSRMATPSRRNSGLTRPRGSGYSASSAPVQLFRCPGKTVLRIGEKSGDGFAREMLPDLSEYPLQLFGREISVAGREGVPTQIKRDIPLRPGQVPAPCRRSAVPRPRSRKPPLPVPARRKARGPPGCWRSWFSSLSTPYTRWPNFARQAAVTQPTYPRPITAMFLASYAIRHDPSIHVAARFPLAKSTPGRRNKRSLRSRLPRPRKPTRA